MTDKEKMMAEYDDMTPSEFQKEVMYEQEGVTKAESLAISKHASIRADAHARLQKLAGNGADAAKWTNLAWELRKAK